MAWADPPVEVSHSAMEELRAAAMVSKPLIHLGNGLPALKESPGQHPGHSNYWDTVPFLLFPWQI